MIHYQNKFGKFYRKRILITIIYPKKYCQSWFVNRKIIYFELPLTKKEKIFNNYLKDQLKNK